MLAAMSSQMWRSVVELTPIKHICIGYLAPPRVVRRRRAGAKFSTVPSTSSPRRPPAPPVGRAILAAIAVRHRMREPPILFTGRHQGASGRRVSMGVNSTNGDLVAVAGRTSATKRVTAVVHHLAGLDGEEGKKRCE